MRNLCLMICLLAGQLHAQYNPLMRKHFGASNAFLRLNAAYFYTPENTIRTASPESANSNADYGLIPKMRIGLEAMLLLNNRGNFTESVSRTAPRFVLLRLHDNGPDGKLYGSLSFAQGIPCMSSIPFFGQVKGYWSAGAVMGYDHENGFRPNTMSGARIGFNAYNKKSALQSEVIGFKNRVVVNVIAYRKLGEHIMFHAGAEYNNPLAGFSFLAGSCRISINTRLCKNQMQHGAGLTINL